MCHFILALVPADSNMDSVSTIFNQHGLGFKPINNTHVSAQVGVDTVQIITTRWSCDCGTELASASRPEAGPHNSEHQPARLRSRGWSDARIQRWLAEKASASEKSSRERQRFQPSEEPEMQRWIKAIRSILESGAASRVGILVHNYSGGLETEQFTLDPAHRLTLSDLNAQVLMQMSEDAVLEVRPDRRSPK